MERDSSGTDYGQYWQPEEQPADGPPQPARTQAGYPVNEQQGYETGYQAQAYSDQQAQPYPDQQYGAQPYPDQQQYQSQDGYSEQGYAGQQYAGQDRPYGGDAYPAQGYSGEQVYPAAPQYPAYGGTQETYADPAAYYAVTDFGAPAAGSDAGWTGSPYQADPYGAQGYPGADPQTAPTDAPEASSEANAAASAAAEVSAEPGSEPAAAGGGSGGRAGRSRRGRSGAGQEAAPTAPTLSGLAAAATGRAPGTDRKSFKFRAAIGAAALAVVVVAGVIVAGHGSGGAKSAVAGGTEVSSVGSHTKTWAAPADAVPGSAADGLIGSWLLPKVLVRGDGTGVSGYDVGTGRKLWTVTPPTAGAVPCAMSPTVNTQGVGAVLFQAKAGSGQACTQLVALNTATGQPKWKAQISTAKSGYQASVMVNDTRAVAVGDSVVTGYDATTGKKSWSYAGPGKFCGALTGNGTGSTVLVQSTCADSNPKEQAVTLDATTGKVAWWRGLPTTAASYTVLSATPAVIAVHMADPTKDSIMSFSAKGDTQATIYVSQTAGTLDSTHGTFDPDPALFFQNGSMIAELAPAKAGASSTAGTAAAGTAGTSAGTAAGGSTDTLTAFNLADGKQLWQAVPKEKGLSALVGIDGSVALVATEERLGQQAGLDHFDLATGREAASGTFPKGTGSLLTSGRLLYQGSMVAVLPEFTSTYRTAATAFTAAG